MVSAFAADAGALLAHRHIGRHAVDVSDAARRSWCALLPQRAEAITDDVGCAQRGSETTRRRPPPGFAAGRQHKA
jgi:hypothetical protein